MIQAGPVLQAFFQPMLQSLGTDRAHSFECSLDLGSDKGIFMPFVYSQWKAVLNTNEFVCFSDGRNVGTSGWGKDTASLQWGKVLQDEKYSFGCIYHVYISLLILEVWTTGVLKQEDLSNTPSAPAFFQQNHISLTHLLPPGRAPAYRTSNTNPLSCAAEASLGNCLHQMHSTSLLCILLLLFQSQDLCMCWYVLVGTPVSEEFFQSHKVSKIPINFATSFSLSESNLTHQLLEPRSKTTGSRNTSSLFAPSPQVLSLISSRVNRSSSPHCIVQPTTMP